MISKEKDGLMFCLTEKTTDKQHTLFICEIYRERKFVENCTKRHNNIISNMVWENTTEIG